MQLLPFRKFVQAAFPLSMSGDATQRPGVALSITKLANNEGWQFQWSSTGDPYYRIVLRGQEINRVFDLAHGTQTYIFTDVGFPFYPPPLEVMPTSFGLAPSEINQPFLVIQWYGETTAASYQVQEFVSGQWQAMFQIAEVGATVYTWQTPLLQDGTTHVYQVVAYNNINQASTGVAFDATPIVTPPDFVDTTYKVTYDSVGHNIVLALS